MMMMMKSGVQRCDVLSRSVDFIGTRPVQQRRLSPNYILQSAAVRSAAVLDK